MCQGTDRPGREPLFCLDSQLVLDPVAALRTVKTLLPFASAIAGLDPPLANCVTASCSSSASLLTARSEARLRSLQRALVKTTAQK